MLRINVTHATLPEPLTLNDVPMDTPFDTFTAMCLKKVGIDGDVDVNVLRDNKYHSKVTAVADLRDEDLVILRPKRTRDDADGDNKRARTEVIDVDPVEKAPAIPMKKIPEEIPAVVKEDDKNNNLHVTCISLTFRTDRRDAIRHNVVTHLPQLVFFDAVDAMENHLPFDMLTRMKVMPKAKEGAREKKTACWASHVQVLERAVAHGAFPHLVMEDDVCVPESFDVPLDDIPKDGVCFLTGKMNAAKVKDFTGLFEVREDGTKGIRFIRDRNFWPMQ